MKSDEMYYNDSRGIYCFFPFEKLDESNRGVVKIGNTTQTFQERLKSYHTYFVYGVYVLFFIKISPKRGQPYPTDFKHILNIVEDYVIKDINEEKQSHVIIEPRRTWKAGQSEWIYTDLKTIKKSFQKAVTHFKKVYPQLYFVFDGVNIDKTINEIKNNYDRNKSNRRYTGETNYYF